MSYGLSFSNSSGVITIDEEFRGYVYLGKYGPSAIRGEYAVDVTCAGFPLVFISLPFNYTAGDGPALPYGNGPYLRSGVCVRRIAHLGGSSWRVWVVAINASPTVDMPVTLRVFGRLDLNYPNGVPGNAYGMRVWNAAGALVFDSGGRPLRLAGNTYDTELRLSRDYPGTATGVPVDDYDDYDTSVALPFSLEGKSVQATTRSIVQGREWTGAEPVFDGGGGWMVYFYNWYDWLTAFWASGNTLYARKVVYDSGTGEEINTQSSSVNTALDSHTRVAVIDDSQFP